MPRANPDVNYEISIHALLAESDPFTTSMSTRLVGFLSTLSLRRATYAPLTSELHCLFLSTLSLRRATFRTPRRSKWGTHFYPRSPCGERRLLQNGFLDVAAISIHALLAESDARLAAFAQHGAEDFYPRSPCGERRYSLRPPPARGEISIHALLAESDHARVGVAAGAVISIHALLAESDVLRQGLGSWSSYFYPRSPCGERLCAEHHANSQQEFLSTLSLRRATTLVTTHVIFCDHFYPRSPCGERPGTHPNTLATKNFYPRSPCGERRGEPITAEQNVQISIHALLAESDAREFARLVTMELFLSTLSLRRATSCFAWNCAKCRYFYPRSPCGERLGQGRDLFLVHFISIHALLAESDPTPRRTLPARSRFLSTLSLRRATDKDREKALNIALFLSTLSLRRATICS